MNLSDENDPKNKAWEQLTLMPDIPKPGQIYEHYKGGLYVIVAIALREDTLVPVVIYRSNLYGMVWERILDNFMEQVVLKEGSRERFRRLSK